MNGRDRIAVLLYRLRFGGAERVMLTVSEELARRGYEVDLVTFDAKGEFAEQVPGNIRLYDMRSLGVVRAAYKISKYLAARAPSAIIANGDRCALASFMARKLRPRGSVRTIAVVHHDLAGVLGLRGVSFKDMFLAFGKKFPMARVYRRVDEIAAVSEGAAASVVNFLGIPRRMVSVIYNPVPVEEIREKASQAAEHPWFAGGGIPVIISSGRLTPHKDFGTLLRAFALLRRETPSRLVILGEGPEREKLEALIRSLGLEDRAALFGFVENPYKYIARAGLFALSSICEGLPTVIMEAMALGIPAVSTDCPSGPAELLAHHPERLVPVGDPDSLAAVMKKGLEIGREENDLSRFSVANCADRYISLISRRR
ncbi:MAG: glycosyltransferase [Synergistaceae bacterium]|jgi:glycosyltransferase involved in cell wall biosynthesis|nr:glycosyltransferase [Synergistaceae bacterium]